jgi:hypothetical protein
LGSRFARPCWRNSDRNRNYEKLVSSRLSAIPLISEDLLLQPRDICSTPHSSARDAGITATCLFKPKCFWCPDLSLLRNRKRFCGPSGILAVVQERVRCLTVGNMLSVPSFRSACCHFAHNAANKGVRKLNALFSSGNLTPFWRKLARRSQAPSSSLCAADFADHYKSIMCDEDLVFTDGQHAIATVVKSYQSSLAGQVFPQTLPPPLMRSLKVSSAPGPDGITQSISPSHFVRISSWIPFTHPELLSGSHRGSSPAATCVIVPVLRVRKFWTAGGINRYNPRFLPFRPKLVSDTLNVQNIFLNVL